MPSLCDALPRGSDVPVLTAGRPTRYGDPTHLIADERIFNVGDNAALREAFARLSPCCQRLIAVLIEDPPVPYAQISARLGLPVGSIGPSRSRCLDKLRRHPAIAALINADAQPGAVVPGHKQCRRRSGEWVSSAGARRIGYFALAGRGRLRPARMAQSGPAAGGRRDPGPGAPHDLTRARRARGSAIFLAIGSRSGPRGS